MATGLEVLSKADFVRYVESRASVEIIDVDAPFDTQEIDSYNLMEIITAVDDLGVVIDESVLAEVTTVAGLYAEYVKEAASRIELELTEPILPTEQARR